MFNLSASQIIIISGLLLILAELVLGIEAGFDLVIIGSILLLGGGVGLYTTTTVALLAVIILSIAYFFFGRRLIKQKIIFTTKKTNVDRLIGQKGRVIRPITSETPGMIRLNDEDWRAGSDEILTEKDKAIVESIEGITLKVKKIN